jgi:hypothetical protein
MTVGIITLSLLFSGLILHAFRHEDVDSEYSAYSESLILWGRQEFDTDSSSDDYGMWNRQTSKRLLLTPHREILYAYAHGSLVRSLLARCHC